LDVDIGDVGIELDPIPNLSSIGNEFQYKSVVWIYLELQFHPIPRVLALNSLASQTAEFRIPDSNSQFQS
jgi:hypothetical protein